MEPTFSLHCTHTRTHVFVWHASNMFCYSDSIGTRHSESTLLAVLYHKHTITIYRDSLFHFASVKEKYDHITSKACTLRRPTRTTFWSMTLAFTPQLTYDLLCSKCTPYVYPHSLWVELKATNMNTVVQHNVLQECAYDMTTFLIVLFL